MRHKILVRTVLAALVVSAELASAQTVSKMEPGTSLGSITLTRKVMADGQPLAAGTYQVRLTGELPTPGVGQSPDAAIYVEFMRAGRVAGREVAVVVSNTDIGAIVKSPKPAVNGNRVELLKGNDYLRVWIHRGGNHYLINMPTAA